MQWAGLTSSQDGASAAIWIQQNTTSGFSLLPERENLHERITEELPLVERIAQGIDPNLAALPRTPDPVLEFDNKGTAFAKPSSGRAVRVGLFTVPADGYSPHATRWH